MASQQSFSGGMTGGGGGGSSFSAPPSTPGMTRSQMLGAAKAASGGLQAMSIFMQAGITKDNLDAKMNSLRSQMEERDFRHQVNVRLLRKQATKTIATQTEAFISGGVKLEGSAIDVVNDTLMDLLNAEMNKEREQSFLNEQSAIEEANLRSKKSMVDTVATINAASSILGSSGGFA